MVYKPPSSAQAWITQLLTCKEHHACLYLVSVHQMAPPLNVVADILSAAYYTFIDPERMKG